MQATFKGQVTLRFVDVRSGKSTREPMVFCNQITEHFYADLIGTNGRIKTGGLLSRNNTIGVSDHSQLPIAGQYTTIGQIKGSGVTMARNRNYPSEDYSAWTYRPEQSPPYAELFNSLPYPGTGTRTFQTIFLAKSSSSADSTPVYAYLLAPDPIIQGTTEIINIFYKIINYAADSPDALVSSLDQDIISSVLSASNSINEGTDVYTKAEAIAFPLPGQPVNNLRKGGVSLIDYAQSQIIALPSFYSHRTSVTVPLVRDDTGTGNTTLQSGLVGELINSVGIGYHASSNSYYRIKPFDLGANQYQGYFPHNVNADTPFVDLSSIPKNATGMGTLAFSGSWNGTLPEHYRLVITGTGATGVATYQLKRKRHTGFHENTYVSNQLSVPYVNHGIATFEGFHGFNNSRFLRISNDEIASWDETGVCAINLRDGSYRVFDGNSSGLEVENISQVACDARLTGLHSGTAATKIWVACRVTGLWEIDLTLETCTQLATDPCYAVDVGYLGKVFAVFGGTNPRLSNSDDYLMALNFSISTITADWSLVKRMKCDPNSTTFQSLIHYGASGTTVWWNTGDPSGLTGPTLAVSNQNSFDVSDTDSTWFGVIAGTFQQSSAHYVVKLTPGSTTTTTITSSMGSGCAPNPCIIGNKLLIQFGNNSTTGNAYALHNTSDGSLIDKFNFIGEGWGTTKLTPANAYLVYMGRNLVFCGAILENFCYLVSAFDNKDYAFESYGWNGSAWVLGETGSRTTHSASAGLLDGISVAFADGDSALHFVETDYYDCFYNDGRLKTNTDTFIYTNFIWYRKMEVATITGGAGLTVPSSSPYQVKLPKANGGLSPDANFLVAYSVHPSFFAFALNGVNVSKINVNGESPGPQEVTVAANGTLTFNAADAGKAITSTKYSYLKM